jgi:hypothetical protein
MATRAKRGTAADKVGVFVYLTPEVHKRYVEAVAERDITKSQFAEHAFLRELEDPTIQPAQGGLYDVA